MTALTGIPISPLVPGSKAWYAKMSASKVAAVLGLSPYDSRFSLFFRMNGTVEPEPQTDEQSRGHYLEPAVCRWFADQHPDFDIEPGGCWQHRDASWYTASPDRLVAVKGSKDYVAGFDAKTCSDDDGYGKPGTDEVPAHVRAQAMSQMDVVGTRRTYVAVLSAYLEFREYVIDYDETEAAFIRAECAQFMDDLANGVRPNLDEHTETYQTIRKLNPGIEDVDVEIPGDVAVAYVGAKADLTKAEAAMQYQTSVVADLLGEGRRARFLDHTIATRQSRNNGTPYLVIGRRLPTFETEPAA
jgi:putative phage-type endonuclease